MVQDFKIETKGESCFDAAHIKLVAEVEELGESSRLLADKVNISNLIGRQGEHFCRKSFHKGFTFENIKEGGS